MDVILRFKGAYAFLSNFYRWPVVYGANVYPTLEHAFQAAKTDNPPEKARILAAVTPGEAKRLGRAVTLRADWEDMKVEIMGALVARKFSVANSELVETLKLTGDDYLVEGNAWHDSFWGVCFCDSCLGIGENMLGKLLMARRVICQEQS